MRFVYKIFVLVLCCVAGICNKMAENEEMEGDYSTDVVSQLLSTKTSTLALMTTSIVLFVALIAKRISSKQSEVILTKCLFVRRAVQIDACLFVRCASYE